MLELLAVAAGVAVLGGGSWIYSVVKRGNAHARWKPLLDEVARKLNGRASPGSMFDAPELRAELDGLTVTLRLKEIHKSTAQVLAESRLPESAGAVRLYFGWDVAQAPPDLAHVPRVDSREGIAKADDAALAARFFDRAMIDLIDVRREANARALEVIARGGYVTLVLYGIQETTHLLERMLIVSSRLAQTIGAVASGTALPPPKTLDLICALCDQPHDTKPWVQCARCEAPYHRACFEQAGSCLRPDCGSTQSRPLEAA